MALCERKLKRGRPRKVEWTDVELEVLVRDYPSMGMNVRPMIPDKTCAQIQRKVDEMGVAVLLESREYSVSQSECVVHYYVSVTRIMKNEKQYINTSRLYDVFECKYCGARREFPIFIEERSGYTDSISG